MSVYVDDMKARYRRMFMCHMMADSHLELFSMACRIGVPCKWIQKRGTYQEHFDICLAMKKRALKLGAIEITQRELVERLKRKREASHDPQA